MKVNLKIINQYPEVKGIFTNGCIKRGEGSRFRAKAHTHFKGKYKGWICFLSEKRLNEKMLLLHEIAHAITNEGHTDKWRKKLLEIGGTLDACNDINGKSLLKSYHKRMKGGV